MVSERLSSHWLRTRKAYNGAGLFETNYLWARGVFPSCILTALQQLTYFSSSCLLHRGRKKDELYEETPCRSFAVSGLLLIFYLGFSSTYHRDHAILPVEFQHGVGSSSLGNFLAWCLIRATKICMHIRVCKTYRLQHVMNMMTCRRQMVFYDSRLV